MQEQTPTEKKTSSKPLQPILLAPNQQLIDFLKYKTPNNTPKTAFKLVKPLSDKQNSQSQSSQIIDSQGNKRRRRGSYRKYTLEQKQQAVKKIMSGHDVKEISKQYGIPRRNLLRWKKNGCERKQGGGRPTDNQLESLLYAKIKNNDIRTQRQIRQEAKKLSKSLNFKASKGWYCKFNRRFTNWKKKNNFTFGPSELKVEPNESEINSQSMVKVEDDQDDDDSLNSDSEMDIQQDESSNLNDSYLKKKQLQSKNQSQKQKQGYMQKTQQSANKRKLDLKQK